MNDCYYQIAVYSFRASPYLAVLLKFYRDDLSLPSVGMLAESPKYCKLKKGDSVVNSQTVLWQNLIHSLLRHMGATVFNNTSLNR